VIRKSSSIAHALGYLSKEIIGINFYLKLLELLNRGNLIKIQLRHDNDTYLYVDLHDEGISRDLLLYRQREVETTKAFKSYLELGQTVIDIGSNIGYYVLMEAAKVSSRGRVYAIEASPHNVEILRKNVEFNRYKNIVDIEFAAISDKSGTAKLHITNRSNLHTLTRVPEMDKYVKFKNVFDIPAFTLDDFIKYKGIEARSIDVIRMDIEGHEVNALKGMSKTLKKAGSLILFIEIHPKLIKQNPDYTYESFLRELNSHGFELMESFLSLSSRVDKRINLNKINDLLIFHEAVELILRKS